MWRSWKQVCTPVALKLREDLLGAHDLSFRRTQAVDQLVEFVVAS